MLAGERTGQINDDCVLMLCRLSHALSCSSGSEHLVGAADSDCARALLNGVK